MLQLRAQAGKTNMEDCFYSNILHGVLYAGRAGYLLIWWGFFLFFFGTKMFV